MADWTERYRPNTLSSVRGNNKARDNFLEWAETWDEHGDPVVLHGAPGVGKTSAAHALAADKGWKVVELNASDQRTADVIERFAGRAAQNTTLEASMAGNPSQKQLVILDEADNIHYQSDRGGSQAVTALLKKANQPIVLIANDYYDMSNGLRNAAQEIEFRDISPRSIVPVLRDILRKEDIGFEEDALKEIAEANRGDLRAAIKDLQTTAEAVEYVSVENVRTGRRDSGVGLFSFLDAVLKEEPAERALQLSYDVDETPDDLLKWVEDKAPKVYTTEELATAYEFLANAELWTARVYTTDFDYSWWRYATDNLAGGVAAARKSTRGGWTRYGGAPYRSTRNATRDEIVRKIATEGGFSMRTARTEVLPYLQSLTRLCRPHELTTQMAAWYELDAHAVSFITGSGESTNKVESIIDTATERRSEAVETHSDDAFVPSVSDVEETDKNSGDSGTETSEDTAGQEDNAEADSVNDQSGLSDFI